MGNRLKFGKRSPWLPDEEVLYSGRSFRAITGASFPTYKISFQAPPLWRITLHVTNRRCLVEAVVAGIMTQEVDLWFPERNPSGRTETIESVAVRKGLFGRCLEIRSRDPKRPWYTFCSSRLTLRFFCRDPEEIERIIAGAMGKRRR